MMPHDILTLYSAKAIEYLIAVVFLALFIPFWRFVNRDARVHVHARAHAHAGDVLDAIAHWFHVPDRTHFHPGHSWARVEADGAITLGMDDFAQKLVGPLRGITLPTTGERLVQGEPAWKVAADSKAVDMVAPVGGVVTEVNPRVLQDPGAVNQDPYGEGWLVKVRSPRTRAQLATLRVGQTARRWMDEVCEGLTSTLSPSLGLVYQDGGVPIDGIARAIAGEQWDELAGRFLLTGDEPERVGVDFRTCHTTPRDRRN